MESKRNLFPLSWTGEYSACCHVQIHHRYGMRVEGDTGLTWCSLCGNTDPRGIAWELLEPEEQAELEG